MIGRWPDAFDGLALGDWPLAILHALRGEVAFLDEVKSVYRRHGAGAWSPKPVAWKVTQAVRMFDVIRPLVERELRDPRAMSAHDSSWTALSMAHGWRARARRHSRRCVKRRPFRPYSWRLLLWTHLGPLGRALNPTPAEIA